MCRLWMRRMIRVTDGEDISDDDMDDEDLLVTSEINYEAVIQQETEDAPKTVGGEINNQSTELCDDASFSDEDLLTD